MIQTLRRFCRLEIIFRKTNPLCRLGLPSDFPLGVFFIRVHPSPGRLNTPTDRTNDRPTGWRMAVLAVLCYAR